jgi:hypothetical protein
VKKDSRWNYPLLAVTIFARYHSKLRRAYILACRDFAQTAYKSLTVHHHFHSILPNFLYQNFPKLPIHEFFPSSSTLSLPKHHQTTILSQIHQSKPSSFTFIHTFPKLHKISLSPSSLNHKWPPTNETPAQRKPPTPSHPQAKPNALVPHPNHPKTPFISSMTKPKSSINL